MSKQMDFQTTTLFPTSGLWSGAVPRGHGEPGRRRKQRRHAHHRGAEHSDRDPVLHGTRGREASVFSADDMLPNPPFFPIYITTPVPADSPVNGSPVIYMIDYQNWVRETGASACRMAGGIVDGVNLKATRVVLG